ncbi:MAG: acyl-CoA dehydrogenase [Alphaproteobacteria bacterium]|nr:acyl-CoA dehydrogenase [Alphaproteobacteria bacterium]
MNFSLSPEQIQLQELARTFARKEMGDVARKIEATNEPPAREILHRFGRLGFLGINLDPEFGGHGLGDLEALLVLEEFARVHPAIAFPIFESTVGPIKAIERFAGAALKHRLMPPVCRGDLTVAVAMSEPDAGTALTDLKTRAELKDGKVVINGMKRWCSGGGHAGGYLVYCRMSRDAGAKGIGAVYVDNGAPGLSFGQREQLMGFRGICSADIFFDNVTVPSENVVVPAGSFGKLMEAFDLERCGNATMCLGLAAGALDDALAYVQERKQFGRPIVDFQAVQLKLAEMAMQVEAARLLIHKAVSAKTSAFPSVLSSSMAKCFANEMCRDVCGKAVQLMGGYGYAKSAPAEQRLRDAWGWGIAGGTIDVQKVNIASALIGRRFNQRGQSAAAGN